MSDGKRFDELSRIWAGPMSRRRALRLSAGVLFGAVGANLLSSNRAGAYGNPCTTSSACPTGECCEKLNAGSAGTCEPLSTGETCCPSLIGTIAICASGSACCAGTCLATGRVCCGSTDCPSGTVCCGSSGCGCRTGQTCLNNACCPTGQVCGSTCCPAGQTCVNNACCPTSQGCGSTCCPPSKVCLNASTGACGCPAGGAPCGNFCCAKGETCSDAAGGCCCPKGATPCGQTCCKSGVACVDRANGGICGCPKGTTPCGSGANLRCCPAGAACRPGCPTPSNNTVAGVCPGLTSDRNLKDFVVPVLWDQRGRRSRE